MSAWPTHTITVSPTSFFRRTLFHPGEADYMQCRSPSHLREPQEYRSNRLGVPDQPAIELTIERDCGRSDLREYMHLGCALDMMLCAEAARRSRLRVPDTDNASRDLGSLGLTKIEVDQWLSVFDHVTTMTAGRMVLERNASGESRWCFEPQRRAPPARKPSGNWTARDIKRWFSELSVHHPAYSTRPDPSNVGASRLGMDWEGLDYVTAIARNVISGDTTHGFQYA